MTLLPLFPIPLYIEDVGLLNDNELEFVNSLETEFNHYSGNSYSLNTYVLNSMPEISEKISEKLDEYVQNVLCPETDVSLVVTQSWINVNKPNTSHHMHTHDNSIISGVYYISPDIPESIKLYKKKENNLFYNTKIVNQFNCKKFNLNVKKGMLILFPSDLTHSVDTNLSSENRISLSFNTFFKGSIGIENTMSFLELK
jgi:uncharacterized protein (TIGR02466 family)